MKLTVHADRQTNIHATFKTRFGVNKSVVFAKFFDSNANIFNSFFLSLYQHKHGFFMDIVLVKFFSFEVHDFFNLITNKTQWHDIKRWMGMGMGVYCRVESGKKVIAHLLSPTTQKSHYLLLTQEFIMTFTLF